MSDSAVLPGIPTSTEVEASERPNELVVRFTYHSPNEEQAKKYECIRGMALDVAEYIDEACPPSREKALALTKLEEAVMWANASIARRT